MNFRIIAGYESNKFFEEIMKSTHFELKNNQNYKNNSRKSIDIFFLFARYIFDDEKMCLWIDSD